MQLCVVPYYIVLDILKLPRKATSWEKMITFYFDVDCLRPYIFYIMTKK